MGATLVLCGVVMLLTPGPWKASEFSPGGSPNNPAAVPGVEGAGRFCETTSGDAELLRQGRHRPSPDFFIQLNPGDSDTTAHDVGFLELGSYRRLDHDAGASCFVANEGKMKKHAGPEDSDLS